MHPGRFVRSTKRESGAQPIRTGRGALIAWPGFRKPIGRGKTVAMKHLLLAAIAAASPILPAAASAPEPEPTPYPGAIAEAPTASDWIAIAPSALLVRASAPEATGSSPLSEPRR